MKKLLFIIVVVAVLVTFFGRDNNIMKRTDESDHVWKEQTDMLDKAKALEHDLLDSSKLQRDNMEQQLDR